MDTQAPQLCVKLPQCLQLRISSHSVRRPQARCPGAGVNGRPIHLRLVRACPSVGNPGAGALPTLADSPAAASLSSETAVTNPALPSPSRTALLSPLWALLATRAPQQEAAPPLSEAAAAAITSLQRPELWPNTSLIAALEALGRLRQADAAALAPALTALSQRVHAGQLPAATACSALAALATLPQRPPEIVKALASAAAVPGAAAVLPPRALHRLLRAASALDWPLPPAALDELANAVSKLHRALPAAEATEVAWVIARRSGDPDAALAALAPAVLAALPGCGMRQLADAARAFAKAPAAAPPGLFNAIATRAATCVDAAAPEDIARVVGAFDLVGLQPDALLEVVERWADRRLAALPPQALALALASFAKLDNRSPRLLATAAACVEGKIDEMSRAELATVLWAFARLGFDPGAPLRAAGVAAAAADPAAFADREMANLLWALARLGAAPGPDALGAVAAGICPVAPRYSGISAALTLWSFATFNYRPSADLCAALAGAVAREAASMDPQSLALAAWALGCLGQKNEDFAARVAAECSQTTGKLESFSPQNLANLCWGLAKAASDPGAEFLAAAEAAAAPRLAQFSPQELFNTCWAFATLRRRAPALGTAAAAELRDRRSEFGPLELSGMLWALGRLIEPPSIDSEPEYDVLADPRAVEWAIAAAARELPGKAPAMAPTQLGMAAWGLGRLMRSYNALRDPEGETSPVPLAAAADALGNALAAAAAEFGAPSLVSAVEGLACLIECGEGNSGAVDGAMEALGARAAALAPRLRPWELSSLAFHLAVAGEVSAAELLLENEHTPDTVGRCAPKGAILVLGAAARCGVCTPGVLRAAAGRLERLSPGYGLDAWHLRVLHGALEALGPQQVRLPPVWARRVRDAGAGVTPSGPAS